MKTTKTQNVLIVAPHLDDDVLGCGGVMAKYIQEGTKVYVAFLTNGNVGDPELFSVEGTERGRKEALLSHKSLGVTETFFFDFPAPRLDAFLGYKISLELSKLIEKLNIDTLFIPHRGDIHKDHTKVFDAALVAVRPIDNCPVKHILAYETLSETEWAPPYADEVFFPTYYVELTKEQLGKKLDAFQCYSSPRVKQHPHPRSTEGITTLAKYRGSNISMPFAESFMLIRSIN